MSEARPSLRPAATKWPTTLRDEEVTVAVPRPGTGASVARAPVSTRWNTTWPAGSTVYTYFWYSSTPTARRVEALAGDSAVEICVLPRGSSVAAVNNGSASLATKTRIPRTATTTARPPRVMMTTAARSMRRRRPILLEAAAIWLRTESDTELFRDLRQVGLRDRRRKRHVTVFDHG